jgi:hypothetical protein
VAPDLAERLVLVRPEELRFGLQYLQYHIGVGGAEFSESGRQ